MNISQVVALRIKELLCEKSMSQYRLEKEAGLSRETLKSIMKGKAKGVTLKTLILLCEGFSIKVSQFLESPLFDYENLNID